jgi:hypothetical protein
MAVGQGRIAGNRLRKILKKADGMAHMPSASAG